MKSLLTLLLIIFYIPVNAQYSLDSLVVFHGYNTERTDSIRNRKELFDYDENGNRTLAADWYWYKEIGYNECDSHRESVYDDKNNKILQDEFYFIEGVLTKTHSTQTQYHYNEEDLVDSSFTYRNLFGSDEWKLIDKKEYVYYDDYQVDSIKTYGMSNNSDSDELMVQSYKCFKYGDSKEVIYSSYRVWDADEEAWRFSVNEFEHDTIGNFIYYTKYKTFFGAKVIDRKTIYEYNTSNQLLSYEDYIGLANGTLRPMSKDLYTYNSTDNTIIILHYGFNSFSPDEYFKIDSKDSIINNSTNNPEKVFSYKYRENTWSNYNLKIIEYINDKAKQEINLSWNSSMGDWINSRKNTFSYNNNNEIITKTYYDWEENEKVWNTSFHYEYYYEEQTLSIPERLNNLTISPNPTYKQLNFSKIAKKVIVYDTSGRIVISANNTSKILVQNLPNGTYIINIDGISKKFIKSN